MRVTLTESERELVRRVLVFANWPKVTSTVKVEEHLSNIGHLTGRMMSYGGDIAQPRGEHVALKDTLAKIASGKKQERDAATSKVNEMMLRHVKATVGLLLPDATLGVANAILGVQAAIWYGVALIIDSRRGLRNRLGQCGAPGCEKFNLTFAGRPQRHCSEEHRRKADAPKISERVERWRKKQKAKRLLTDGKSVDFVCSATGLSEGDVKRLKLELTTPARRR